MPSANVTIFLVALSVLAGVHLLALKFFLYWHYIWLDVPMHVLGGAITVIGVFAFRDLGVPGFASILNSPILILFFLLAVMVAWETFEVWAGIPMEANYRFDTTIDIVAGLVGGWVGYAVASRLKAL